MKKLRYILISFLTICVFGIAVASYTINSKIDNGVHKIELNKEKKSQQINATLDTEKDTIQFENNSNLSLEEQELLRVVFNNLVSSLDLEKGKYLIKFIL